MKGILAALLLLSCTCSARADVVKFETNGWLVQRPIMWTAQLISFDQATGLMTFVYVDRDRPITFKIHYTRVYSLEFNSDNRVDRQLPQMRQSLTAPLDTKPDRKRLIELVKNGLVKRQLKPGTIVDSATNTFTIYGEINSASQNIFHITAEGDKDNKVNLQLARSSLLIWIR